MSETPNTEIKRKRSYEYHKEQKRPENHKNHAGYRHHKNGMKESKQMDENNLTDLFHMCAMQLFHKHGSKAGHYRGQTKILRILSEENEITHRITSYNVCYTKLLRGLQSGPRISLCRRSSSWSS